MDGLNSRWDTTKDNRWVGREIWRNAIQENKDTEGVFLMLKCVEDET